MESPHDLVQSGRFVLGYLGNDRGLITAQGRLEFIYRFTMLGGFYDVCR